MEGKTKRTTNFFRLKN